LKVTSEPTEKTKNFNAEAQRRRDAKKITGSDVFCGLSTSVGNIPLFWGYFCGDNPENVQFLPNNGAF
jgi:hypothetical protein